LKAAHLGPGCGLRNPFLLPSIRRLVPRSRALLIAVLTLAAAAASAADDMPRPAAEIVRIGVLSHRGDALTQSAWSPTADYLTRALPG